MNSTPPKVLLSVNSYIWIAFLENNPMQSRQNKTCCYSADRLAAVALSATSRMPQCGYRTETVMLGSQKGHAPAELWSLEQAVVWIETRAASHSALFTVG